MRSQIRQLRLNLITNVLFVAATMVVGVVYTPYMVRSLGISAYAVVPLAVILNQYITLLTGSLTSSLTRFYSVSLQRNDYSQASVYLNLSFRIVLTVGTVILPLGALLVTNLDSVFNVPAEQLRAARILFAYTLAGVCLSMLASVMNLTLYALNRLDLMNMIKICRWTLRLVLVVFFFRTRSVSVIYIGVSNVAAELAALFLSYYYYRLTKPAQVRMRICGSISGVTLAVLGTSLWTLIHTAGDITLYNIDTVFVNIFRGSAPSGILGAISEPGNFILLLSSVFISLTGPVMIAAYARDNHYKILKLALSGSYLVGAFTAVVCGVLIGFSEPVLQYWLGGNASGYGGWFIVKVAVLPFVAASSVLGFIYRAWNQVKLPALFSVAIGSLNCIVAYLLLRFLPHTSDTILILLIVSATFMLIQRYVVNCICLCRIYPGAGRKLLLNFFAIVGIMSMTIVISRVIAAAGCGNVTYTVMAIALSGIISLAFTYRWLLDEFQKKMVVSTLIRRSTT